MHNDDQDQKSFYERNGKSYPRVTHVLKVLDKPGLARWRGREGNSRADEISREGSRIGTAFHEVCQEIHMGRHQLRGWQAPGEFRYMADAYIDWLHRHIARIEFFERQLYSDGPTGAEHPDEPPYAGTVDLVGWVRGDPLPSVIDVKTSNNYSDDWPLQLSGYRRLLKLNDVETQRRIIVRIPKEGKVVADVYDFSQAPGADEADERAWLDALSLWNWQQAGKERRKAAKVVVGL